ncbi:electron transfer flavoprotein subunit beta/FixA family protein [Sedimentisphaera salicampi]|uniref:electron transfer flavoprotein subunit beta/FixA family protein n=1 Tax=Sedimentisphaera salicampi TaxID=1941349 RepID=UPI000B9AC0D4|nr:electron transfer flavoprotein subunit beta/FixA family protein [Sedimentisphaera salicampi]OXU15562.1 Electron transfer flavoprotein small subunit [Sedimentisphaera salicampi]
MKIIVLIKQVPEIKNAKIDPESGTIIRSKGQSIINPLDLYALETALMLKDNLGATVQAISMGPKRAESVLREALALGADSAALISDRVFAGSDTWATSLILSKTVSKINYDLIICGERAIDGDTGQVGPGVASFLNIPVVSFVKKINFNVEDGIEVEREVEDGSDIIQVSLPAVITVVKDIASPRMPTLRGKKLARNAKIDTLNHIELGLKPDQIGIEGSPTKIVKTYQPEINRKKQIFNIKEKGLDNSVEHLAEQLNQGLTKC